ncbi:hypothetical protein FBY06_11545 [Pseudomonas sp. SJZ085]|uniref:hypothetical protein n=1 Tax=unclassified Pseudomonas TaxID=196821 RepID=UPI00119BBF95|nr:MULTISPECIES: hypothetical protein [unclassified Pseudomonas]TWC18120.1 hypothetical protein FBX99_11545 [Pseudomonas sp. SJZ074]TWC36092.1 hypothetical protein FBY06_11545 [Pseudomonas sp. SJZ085]
MARLSLIQTNFTAGEVSPRMLGRVDLSRYQNGAETIENAWPVIHGGAVRRDGTLFVAAAKFPDKKCRLIPYVFNTEQAYMCEFGDLYVRIYYPNGTYTGVELVSPYSHTMLDRVDYVQGADTMFIFNTSVPVYRLRRLADTEWSLAPAPFVTKPFDEKGIDFTTSITFSDPTVGTGRTATSAASAFLASDVDREIWSGGGVAKITAYTSATVVTVEVLNAFTAAVRPTWSLKGSPQTTNTLSAATPVGGVVTMTLGAAGWRSNDVGKFVKINGGLLEISVYTSVTVVSGIIRSAPTSAVASPANAWSLEASVWNDIDGYPGAGTLYEQRLALGGSVNYPQTIWESRTGEYLNFELGTKDDDALSYNLSSDQINPILHMGQINALVPLTYGGEFTVSGGVEKAITPTNIRAKNPSVYGCNRVRPVRIGNELYFVQRASRKLRAMAYKYDSDTFGSPDMSILSEHATKSGIVDMAYQQEPESILYLVRADGVMATMTVDRDQDVIGWARQITDGAFESAASIPVANGDQVWCVVRRTVNGQNVRYIERFTQGIRVDSGISATSVPGASVWGGLGHLEGKTVDIVADGIVMQQQVVAGGQVTIPRNAFAVQIGLNFVTKIKTLTPEVQGSTGSVQGNSMRIGEITLRFLETTGCKVNGQIIAFRSTGAGTLDQPPDLFTGVHRMENLGWDRGQASITITQEQPLPFQLLSVIKKATFND